MIGNIATIAVYVHDCDVALAFYTERLGFEVRKKVEMPGMKWYEVAPPGAHSTLVLADKGFATYDEVKVGRYTDIAFDTDDIAATHLAYTGNGVRFTQEPRLEPYGKWFAAFVDQDDNEYFLFQDVGEDSS